MQLGERRLRLLVIGLCREQIGEILQEKERSRGKDSAEGEEWGYFPEPPNHAQVRGFALEIPSSSAIIISRPPALPEAFLG